MMSSYVKVICYYVHIVKMSDLILVMIQQLSNYIVLVEVYIALMNISIMMLKMMVMMSQI